MTTTNEIEVSGDAPFLYDSSLRCEIDELQDRVVEMRNVGKLSPDKLRHIRKYFKLKDIYHSNAIEGNALNIGETRQVVEMGLTIAGKPLRDQAEAKNLSAALDFLENLAKSTDEPISLHDVRQIHLLILKGIDDANAGGFRKQDVVISGSDYEPPSHMDVENEISALMQWLGPVSVSGQVNAIVTAAAAHAWFAQIHPFVDGNGRTARILMNLVLMRAGYPIAIVTREDRSRYIDALEQSQIGDLTPFIKLISECVSETLEQYEDAAAEQQQQNDWAQSFANKYEQPQLVKVENEYELWRNAMELMLSHYKSVVDQLNDELQLSRSSRLHIKEFGMLEFEKYTALRERQSTKRTWFFRVDFRQDNRTARYMHTFRWADRALAEHSTVSLRLGREREGSPYTFDWLDDVALNKTNVPALREIAYSPTKETFVSMNASRRCQERKIEEIARTFFDEVRRCHFQNY